MALTAIYRGVEGEPGAGRLRQRGPCWSRQEQRGCLEENLGPEWKKRIGCEQVILKICRSVTGTE